MSRTSKGDAMVAALSDPATRRDPNTGKQWSNRSIAARLGVDESKVRRLRQEVAPGTALGLCTFLHRLGGKATMHVGAIDAPTRPPGTVVKEGGR